MRTFLCQHLGWQFYLNDGPGRQACMEWVSVSRYSSGVTESLPRCCWPWAITDEYLPDGVVAGCRKALATAAQLRLVDKCEADRCLKRIRKGG